MKKLLYLSLSFVLLCLSAQTALAAPPALPEGLRVIRDVAYGRDPRQRFDVYAPAQAQGAPVIFMVHGGGWRLGDKQARGVVDHKLARWAPQGFVLISANYRLLPQARPIEQAQDIAQALAAAQEQAASWGADRRKFILMGHSAGAHLVALLATSPALGKGLQLTPWLGSVLLDSAAMNVVQLMQTRHLGLYDRAFGADSAYWRQSSPLHALTRATAPLLAVCSTRREKSCAQADLLVAKATALGSVASTLKLDMSHGDINQRLGEEPGYTRSVEAFMASLDDGVAARLGSGD
jgi:acetyl esterase/lipase